MLSFPKIDQFGTVDEHTKDLNVYREDAVGNTHLKCKGDSTKCKLNILDISLHLI